MIVDWTTVIASAVTASIVSGASFVSNRYLARMLDRIEKALAKTNRDKGKNGNGTS